MHRACAIQYMHDFLLQNTKVDHLKKFSTVFHTMKVNVVQTTLNTTDFNRMDKKQNQTKKNTTKIFSYSKEEIKSNRSGMTRG